MRSMASGLRGANGRIVHWRLLALPLAGLLVSGALAGHGHSAAQLWTLLVVVPIVEETVFRAGVHELLLRHVGCTAQMAILLTAALFGLAHVLVRGDAQAFIVAIPALGLGVIYDRWQQVRACAAAHAAMNALWLISGAAAGTASLSVS